MDQSLRTMLGTRLRNGIREGKVTVDYNGHFASGRKAGSLLQDLAWTFFLDASKTLIGDVSRALDKRQPMPNFVPIRDHALAKCHQCGRALSLETNGVELRIVNACEYPEGVNAYNFDLNVPTGKLAVGNDFRRIFRVTGIHDCGSAAATMEVARRYARVGMAHGYVGNSCPGFYSIGKTKKSFAVGIAGDTSDYHPLDGTPPIGEIVTEIPWYCVADLGEFHRRAIYFRHTPYHVEVECEPGMYRFTHVHHLVADQKPAVYAFIHRCGPSVPLHDHIGDFTKINIDASHVIGWMVKHLPVNKSNIFAAANKLLCSPFSEECYHPNGWLCFDPGVTQEYYARIPVFGEKFAWTLGESSPLAYVAGCGKEGFLIKLNDSFLALAFNVCRSIIMYGVKHIDVNYAGNCVKMAHRCLLGMAIRYPRQVPFNCRTLLG
jgi:hypothetical protein